MNQDIKADEGKLQISLVPTEIVRNIAAIRMYGNKKYPKNTWKEVEVERYIDALDRHILLFNDDPTGFDEESGYPHLWHVACNVAFLCELMKGEWK